MVKSVVFPPNIIDQSFPRAEQELIDVLGALANLQELAEQELVEVILTENLCDFLETYDWEREVGGQQLSDIYRLISGYALQQGQFSIRLDVSTVVDYDPHPYPESCDPDSLILLDHWQEEVGKMLAVHDHVSPNEYFIGLICDRSLVDAEISVYPDGVVDRKFPIVSGQSISSLADPFEWIIDRSDIARDVPFKDAKKNIHLIGATSVKKPRGHGGSHYMVTFSGARSWPLDKNDDPLPDAFVRQLQSICGIPFKVIKYVLLNGSFPEKLRKIPIQYLLS